MLFLLPVWPQHVPSLTVATYIYSPAIPHGFRNRVELKGNTHTFMDHNIWKDTQAKKEQDLRTTLWWVKAQCLAQRQRWTVGELSMLEEEKCAEKRKAVMSGWHQLSHDSSASALSSIKKSIPCHTGLKWLCCLHVDSQGEYIFLKIQLYFPWPLTAGCGSIDPSVRWIACIAHK